MVAAQSVFDDWYPAPLEETLALVEWMRAYNAGAPPGRALHFYGIDLTGGWGYEHARRVPDSALDYIGRVDPGAAAELRARLDPLLATFTTQGYASLAPPQRARLTAAIALLVTMLETRRPDVIAPTPKADHEPARRPAVSGRPRYPLIVSAQLL